jgi:NADPH:quinone reductase-like Zn-dependent oxidoreductase
MRAVRIQRFGSSEQVQVEDVPTPGPGAGQALVRVVAAAVNPVDWMIRERIYNPPGADRVPLTLGQDFAGVIERLGPGSSTDLREGDEVFGETWGSFAEYALVPVEHLVRKPLAIDFPTAAAIPMPALTAWQVVNDTARAANEMRFLVHGASGGVGAFAAQFARRKGALVAATASPESFPFLAELGVDPVIDYHRERFEDRVRDLDVVIDPIGGEVQARSFAVLKRGGLLVNLIGEVDEAAARRAGVRGVAFAMRYDVDDLREIAGLVEQRKVVPHLVRVMPLERAREALDLNQQHRSHGQIVLEVR